MKLNYINVKKAMELRNNYKQEAANRYHSYQKIIAATSHMNCVENLDERIIHLTVMLKRGQVADIISPFYTKLCYALTGKGYPKLSSRPGMVAYEDYVGSRYRYGHDFNNHFHALIILASRPSASCNTLSNVANVLNNRFSMDLRLHEVDNVKFIAYDFADHPKSKPVCYVDSYNAKAYHHNGGEHFSRDFYSGIFPRDICVDGNKSISKNIDQLKQAYWERLESFNQNPAAFFSEKYMHEFGEELSGYCRYFGRKKIRHHLT